MPIVKPKYDIQRRSLGWGINALLFNYYLKIALLLLAMVCSLSFASPPPIVPPHVLTEIEQIHGKAAKQRTLDWLSLIEKNHSRSTWYQLNAVNKFFNRLPFIADLEHWSTHDYWATPLEFLISDGGDCEDYTAAKYHTLKQLGFSEDSLRLLQVNVDGLENEHMVLAYYENEAAEPLILDSIEKKIHPLKDRRDIEIIYSFNQDGLWLMTEPQGTMKRVGDGNQISKWTKLIQRMKSNAVSVNYK